MYVLHNVSCRRIRVDEYEAFWAAKRAEMLQRAGLPANSTTCPQQFDTRSSSTTKGLTNGVAVGVATASYTDLWTAVLA